MFGYGVLCKSWPGGEVNLMNIEGVGLKNAAWRNWANYFLVLFICTMALSTCVGGQVGVIGVSHRPSDMLRLPVRIMFFFQHLKGFLVKNGLTVIIT